MKFNEMKYERLDIPAICAEYDALSERVKNAASFDETLEAVARHETLSKHMYTMISLANVRHTIDTTDKYYEDENNFYDENGPVLSEKTQNFAMSLLKSPFRSQLSEKYGSLMFDNLEMETKAFKPEIIPELQKENALVSEYQKLCASAKIEFDGKVLTVPQLKPYRESPDREVRRSATFAEGEFYMSHADELDRIFDDLVKVRTEIAHKLGYKSFTEVAYLRRTRNCYDPEMVKNFREQVKRDLVPIVCGLKKKQSERIGVKDMKFYDDTFCFADGNAKPIGTPDDILAAGKRMYEEMSPETAEFINFMYDNELLDVLSKPGKANGGYCTEFPDYGAPFIFSNFNGTAGDVDVLTHEAGHAYAAYQNRNSELMELSQPTMESCECHSMSMEFLAWPWLELYYGSENVDKARFAHLEDALIFIPYGCMVDDFQHIMYDRPELTPAERNKIWAELERQYRPYIDCEGIPFYGDGRGWQRQLHIYHYPFYYIDYCLAQTVALEFWALSQKDYGDAWKRYNAFVDQGGRKTFVELCKTANITPPFADGALLDIAGCARDWLEDK